MRSFTVCPIVIKTWPSATKTIACIYANGCCTKCERYYRCKIACSNDPNVCGREVINDNSILDRGIIIKWNTHHHFTIISFIENVKPIIFRQQLPQTSKLAHVMTNGTLPVEILPVIEFSKIDHNDEPYNEIHDIGWATFDTNGITLRIHIIHTYSGTIVTGTNYLAIVEPNYLPPVVRGTAPKRFKFRNNIGKTIIFLDVEGARFIPSATIIKNKINRLILPVVDNPKEMIE